MGKSTIYNPLREKREKAFEKKWDKRMETFQEVMDTATNDGIGIEKFPGENKDNTWRTTGGMFRFSMANCWATLTHKFIVSDRDYRCKEIITITDHGTKIKQRFILYALATVKAYARQERDMLKSAA